METETKVSINNQPPSQNSPVKTRSGIWPILIVLAVLAAAGLILQNQISKKSNQESVPSKETAKETQKPAEETKILVELNENQPAPKLFPLETPLEPTGTVLANVNTETQGTRSFLSDKSVDENFTLYKDFLEKDGWVVTVPGTLSPDGKKQFTAIKGNLGAVVYFSTNQASGKTLVSLNFVVKPEVKSK